MASAQALIDLLSCRRRNQSPTSAGTMEGAMKSAHSPALSEKSTEPGDLSDHSDLTCGTPDDSDNEVAFHGLTLTPPPGLAFPPGFGAPPGLTLEQPRHAQTGTRSTRLNSQAPVFVPGSNTAQSLAVAKSESDCAGISNVAPQTISLLNGVLETTERQQQAEKPSVQALQEAVSKLTANDAAVLRSLLNASEAEKGRNPPAAPAQQASAFSALHPGPLNLPAMATQPPPGMFCYNLLATSAPGAWASVSSKSAGHTRTPSSDTPESSAASTADEAKETLRTNLRDLSLADPACVLMVRKINRLGLDSPNILEAHFSKFGNVERVMVSHSRAKSMFGRGAARVRPAGLGFMIMTNPEDVEAVLTLGSEQEIQGHTITVHRFEGRSMDGVEVEENTPHTE